MAELLQLRGIGQHAGPRLLFRNFDLVLGDRDRLSLIGPNGGGKTTLLRILCSDETADEGQRTSRRGLRIAWLEQEPRIDPAQSSLDYVLERLRRDPGPPAGLDPEVVARAALQRAGFENPDAPVRTLSGGWTRRVAVVAELATAPDLLLLDEPTNHLDLEGIEWLEQSLARVSHAVVVISHDRHFLERVSTRVLEIDGVHRDGWMMVEGSYTDYLERREQARREQHRAADALASIVRDDIRYLRQGAKARTTKSASRVSKAHANIEELESLRSRNEVRGVEGAFHASGRRTKRLVSAEQISLRRGAKTLLRDGSFVLGPGRRMGLVGPNGSGKSSLLLALQGELALETGELRIAPNLKIVYFDQRRQQLDAEKTIAQILAPDGDTVLVRGRKMHLKSWTRQLGFRDDQVAQPVKSLSGGERARVLMGQLMCREADVLLLDEPTNDLDLPTLEMLERSLLEFTGAIVLVTHDRFLLDRVCTTLFALSGDGAWVEVADRPQWQAWARDRAAESLAPSRAASKNVSALPKTPKTVKLSYKEQREFDGLEDAILQAESDLAEQEACLTEASAQSETARLVSVGREVTRLQEEIEHLYARWSELEEKRGGNA
jgi:ABC transport system ATP-binding/permease protein